jgi:hypothetical protein
VLLAGILDGLTEEAPIFGYLVEEVPVNRRNRRYRRDLPAALSNRCGVSTNVQESNQINCKNLSNDSFTNQSAYVLYCRLIVSSCIQFRLRNREPSTRLYKLIRADSFVQGKRF